MSLTLIIVLILIGIVLILIEFLIIPGTNIAGIIGLALIIGGVILGYRNLELMTAHILLGATFVFMAASIYFALRSNTWRKMSLNTSIDSKIETIDKDSISVGDSGVTVTRLAPIGKVQINDKFVEAKSHQRYVEPNVPVVVREIVGNQIIVGVK